MKFIIRKIFITKTLILNIIKIFIITIIVKPFFTLTIQCL